MDKPTSAEASTTISGLARLTQKQVRLREEVTALQQVLRQSADGQAQWQKDQLATAQRDLERLEKAQSDIVLLIDLLQKEIGAQERCPPPPFPPHFTFFTEASADVSFYVAACRRLAELEEIIAAEDKVEEEQKKLEELQEKKKQLEESMGELQAQKKETEAQHQAACAALDQARRELEAAAEQERNLAAELAAVERELPSSSWQRSRRGCACRRSSATSPRKWYRAASR